MKKLAIIFGGQNTEHSVSIMSALGICSAINYEKYEVTLIYIDEDGLWFEQPTSQSAPTSKEQLIINTMQGFDLNDLRRFDVAMPILHGTKGEDGTVQGLFELLDVPYVGCDIFSSAAAIDKVKTRILCEQMQIPLVNDIHFTENKWRLYQEHILGDILRIPFPLFVKPPKLGSSVGVSKATNREELIVGIEEAFRYGTHVLIEQGLKVRELEIGILGNEHPLTSKIGEVSYKTSSFYDFETKYQTENASLQIPANISKEIEDQIQKYAITIYEGLGCKGLARLDFFLTDEQKIYFNEINTFPGFTTKSMYPKLWEASGIPYDELINRLIDLALENATANNRILKG